jgi:LacI family transcriptional regulator
MRAVARGIARYTRSIPGLSVRIGDTSGLDYLLSSANGPVITAIYSAEVHARCCCAKVPVINISSAEEESLLPRVIPDNRAIGRLAAEHFLDMGFRDFAFAGGRQWFSRMRCEGFVQTLAEHGATCRILNATDSLPSVLPKLSCRTAILVQNDQSARYLIAFCQDLGLSVPADIAVVGVDNDDILCTEMTPLLTSVDPNGEQIGFEAARLAHALLHGRSKPAGPVLVPPKGLVVRESSDTLAVDSAPLARAVAFIRQHACESITVADVAGAARITRRTLHNLCRKHLASDVSGLVRRERIARAKTLLLNSNRTITDIAAECGFVHYSRFYSLFGRMTGVTPGVYRRQRRIR